MLFRLGQRMVFLVSQCHAVQNSIKIFNFQTFGTHATILSMGLGTKLNQKGSAAGNHMQIGDVLIHVNIRK